jgi:hypothetical protein
VAALTNLSFETAAGDGVSPASWTITYQSSVEELNVFADGGVLEGFEDGWDSNDSYEWALTNGNSAELQWTNPASTLPLFQEGFEVGWSLNQSYDLDLAGSPYVFSAQPGGQEAFEAGWYGNEDYEWAAFGGSAVDLTDGFETGWYGNSGFERTLTLGTNAVEAPWRSGTDFGNEGFEYVLADFPVTVNTSTGLITPASTVPLITGETVLIYTQTGSLPTGYLSATLYTLLVSGSSIYLQLGGTTVIPSDTGTGILYVSCPNFFWNDIISL